MHTPRRQRFKTPPGSTVIWRYMGLSKFESFIKSRAMWFAAAKSFSDPFEGTKAAAETRVRDALWDDVGVPEEQREIIRGSTDWNRQLSFVNCWMMNTAESEWMWHRYAEGIGAAVESTYSRLRAALPNWIWIHEVEYIDYEEDSMIEWHSLAPFFYKRQEFADERELRAVIEVFQVGDPRRLGTTPLRKGHLIEVDVSRVVSRVIVSPSPTPDILKRVTQLVAPFRIPIANSSLDKIPRW